MACTQQEGDHVCRQLLREYCKTKPEQSKLDCLNVPYRRGKDPPEGRTPQAEAEKLKLQERGRQRQHNRCVLML